MNKVILCGRLTKDPDMRTTTSGVTISRYSLAVDRYGDGADFISMVAFNKQAEFCEKYLKKGMKILIEGHIHTGSYESDGRRIYTTDVVVDRHEFVERKQDLPKEGTDDFMDVPDNMPEGLPF